MMLELEKWECESFLGVGVELESLRKVGVELDFL